MQVIFIHHSCFLVEVDDLVLIFDYFGGDRVNGFHFTGKIPDYAPDTKIYMFASHKHQDHFDMDILRWSEKYTNVHYILSKDIRISPHFLQKHGIDPGVRKKVTFVSANNHYEVDDLKIQTLLSTDAGVAFYVNVRGVSIFHAGDLNNWHWSEESTEAEIRKANGDFLAEVKYLKEKAPEIDLALFPVDRRMGKDYMKGAKQFIEQIKTTIFVPMHFSEDYEGGNALRDFAENAGCRFISITHRGESFEITK